MFILKLKLKRGSCAHVQRVRRRARRAGRALGRSRAARMPVLCAAEEDAWLECRIKWRDCSDRPIARRPASTSCIPADPLVQGICDAAVLVMLGSGSLAGQLPQAASPQPSCSDDSRYMHWLGLCGVARRPASTSCIPAAPLFRGLATLYGRARRGWGMEGPGGAGAGGKADTVCWEV